MFSKVSSSRLAVFLGQLHACRSLVPFSNCQGPVVQRPISSNPGLNLSPAFFISLFKSFWENFHYSF